MPFVAAFAPARTPPAIVARLSREMNAALNQPEIRQRFAASGVEVIGSSPQDLAAVMQAEMRRLGRLIKDLGIREDGVSSDEAAGRMQRAARASVVKGGGMGRFPKERVMAHAMQQIESSLESL